MSYKRYNKPKNPPTFLFHDYETFHKDAKTGRAAQFASIRTDADLNILPDEKLNIYCEISSDSLPDPEACLITGQTPQHIERIKEDEISKGVEPKNRVVMNEDKFTLAIIREMGKGNTCNIGYNNVSFDDEFTRNLLYRTLRNPYSREWQGGCSRADAMRFIMFAYAVDPNVINFPQAKDRETGEPLFSQDGLRPLPSFRLEELSVANGISHENAHDAFADVEATIAILKLIKDRRPDIFNHVFEMRIKKAATNFLDQSFDKPIFHVSQFYGKENFSLAVVQQVGTSPKNPNDRIVINLSKDITPILELDQEELKKRLYMKKDELEELGLERPPIQTMTVNKCIGVGGLEWIKERSTDLNLSGEMIRRNRSLLLQNFDEIKEKMNFIYAEQEYEPIHDVDLRLYDGFTSKDDEAQMKEMHNYLFRNELDGFEFNANTNEKIKKLFFRFKARNYPDLLGVKETEMWNRFVKERVTGKHWNDGISDPEYIHVGELPEMVIDSYIHKIEELQKEHSLDPSKMAILDELLDYGKRLVPNHPKFKNLGKRPKL